MKGDYNEDLKVELKSNMLSDYSIAYCVTGGIAAIESPKIARELRRHGANVNCYATMNALKFVGVAALEWAIGKNITVELTGLAEHIAKEDLVLVAPATMNTINKMMVGIADNNVTSLIASSLGQNKPVYVAPTMHDSLYNNPFFQENLERFEKYGVRFISPMFEEGKAKMASVNNIRDRLLEDFGGLNYESVGD